MRVVLGLGALSWLGFRAACQSNLRVAYLNLQILTYFAGLR